MTRQILECAAGVVLIGALGWLGFFIWITALLLIAQLTVN